MKIIAYYLPQFHTFPENDKWWGEGYTEWTGVKAAKPLFNKHYQPRKPYKGNYYNLTETESLEWQSKIAKEHGVYGFCYYHYWFNGKMLMEKPAEIMLENTNVDMPFCFCWANHTWTKAWAMHSREVLIEQTYGDEKEWREHFTYFQKFFDDPRYIRIDNKPVLVIYKPDDIKERKNMIQLWKEMATECGYDGLVVMYQHYSYNHIEDKEAGHLFDYGIEFQPGKVKDEQLIFTAKIALRKFLNVTANKLKIRTTKFTSMWYSYDDVWRRILASKPIDDKMIPGAFVDFDNTARYKKMAAIYYGATPEKFKKYLTQQIKNARFKYKKDMLFMFAWNEWGESGYLEPDERYEYQYLEAIKEALTECNELPDSNNERSKNDQ